MGKRFGTVTLIVGIAAGVLAGIAVGGPLLANAAGTATPSPSATAPSNTPRADRLAAFKAALKSLVDDGTITQAQADKIAARLDQALPKYGDGDGDGPGDFRGGMHGMHGLIQGGFDAAAKALGMTSDQVRQGLQAGKSLADLAKQKGVAESKVVDALVTQAKADLDQAVKDGRLTSDNAATISSKLKERITWLVEHAPPAFGRGFGGPMGGGSGGPGSGQSGSNA
jgi:ribosomal protein S20